MPRNAPCNTDDIIDSRDIIERMEELASFFTPIDSDEDIGEDFEKSERFRTWAAENPDEATEYRTLAALAAEASGSPDWEHGETLIRASYFKEYAQELADDIGAVPKDLQWPCNCIDWDQAADELRHDYLVVDFDGVEYLIRA